MLSSSILKKQGGREKIFQNPNSTLIVSIANIEKAIREHKETNSNLKTIYKGKKIWKCIRHTVEQRQHIEEIYYR